MGLVQRVADRRGNLLEATERGQAMYAELFPQLANINCRLMAVLDETEADLLERTLTKLLAYSLALYEEGGGVNARANRRKGGARKVRAMKSTLLMPQS